MKTTLFFPAIRVSSCIAITCCLVLALATLSCEKPITEPVVTDALSIAPATPAQQFIGIYEVKATSCSTSPFRLEINDRGLVNQEDHEAFEEGKLLYLKNFMHSTEPMTAVWDGGAFVITGETIRRAGRSMLVNARMYKYLDEVTIDYQINDQYTSRCTATFEKL